LRLAAHSTDDVEAGIATAPEDQVRPAPSTSASKQEHCQPLFQSPPPQPLRASKEEDGDPPPQSEPPHQVASAPEHATAASCFIPRQSLHARLLYADGVGQCVFDGRASSVESGNNSDNLADEEADSKNDPEDDAMA
jgi:hypothetical protein